MTGGDGLFLGVDVGTSATRVSLVRPDAGGGIASAVTASAGYLRALREPLPGLRAVVSGGIAAGEVGDYLAAGAHAVCLGGALIDREAARRGSRECRLSLPSHGLAGRNRLVVATRRL